MSQERQIRKISVRLTVVDEKATHIHDFDLREEGQYWPVALKMIEELECRELDELFSLPDPR